MGITCRHVVYRLIWRVRCLVWMVSLQCPVMSSSHIFITTVKCNALVEVDQKGITVERARRFLSLIHVYLTSVCSCLSFMHTYIGSKLACTEDTMLIILMHFPISRENIYSMRTGSQE